MSCYLTRTNVSLLEGQFSTQVNPWYPGSRSHCNVTLSSTNLQVSRYNSTIITVSTSGRKLVRWVPRHCGLWGYPPIPPSVCRHSPRGSQETPTSGPRRVVFDVDALLDTHINVLLKRRALLCIEV